MRKALSLLGLSAVLSVGCGATPSPLAPNVRGSIGLPHQGVLTAGEELPAKGRGFRRLRPRAPAAFGTPSLVSMLKEAAEATSPGADDPPLVVGDMAARRGGLLPGHHSHRTGRDVDLLFFYVTPSGAPVDSPGFVRVGPDGLAMAESKTEGSRFVRFDVERNWKLVRSLVASARGEVEWLFVSEPVEALLVDYARARGEPDELVWRAESVMHQPKDSSPHDDHFHLRIACTADEQIAGCFSGGPEWPWLAASPKWKELDTAELALLVADDPAPSGGEKTSAHTAP
jgi:penicillin-insensitive murein DD-endopeptidase